MADYSIKLDLLYPSESRRLADLGVELPGTAATFARKLSAEEMREIWHILADLYSRTGDDDNLINFALGDWAGKAEEWFGKELPSQWVKEYNFLKNFRDHLLKLAGATLVQIQSLEHIIQGCSSLLGLSQGADSAANLLSSDPKTRTRTLGQLVAALRNVQIFDESFEARLSNFVHDRNAFVHYFWRDLTSKYPGAKLRSEAVLREVEEFILRVFRASSEIGGIFIGLYYEIGKNSAANESKLTEFSQVFPEWAAHAQSFQSVMRRHPPSPQGKPPRK
jgi:hypothetical protein